jgi:hypothetical protein
LSQSSTLPGSRDLVSTLLTRQVCVRYCQVLISNVAIHYIYDRRGSQSRWSTAEDDIIKTVYPSEDKDTLLELLPTRSWHNIQGRGSTLKVKRPTHSKSTSDIPNELAREDVTALGLVNVGYDIIQRGCHWRDLETYNNDGYS